MKAPLRQDDRLSWNGTTSVLCESRQRPRQAGKQADIALKEDNYRDRSVGEAGAIRSHQSTYRPIYHFVYVFFKIFFVSRCP